MNPRTQTKKAFLVIPLVATSLWAVTPACAAFDGASIEVGSASHLRMVRVGVQWKWSKRWWQSDGVHLGGYWDATLAHWLGDHHKSLAGIEQEITAIGITPVFRLQRDSGKGLYGEAGIGLHWLSDLYDNAGRRLSTRMQFGDHIAIGYILRNNLDLKLKLQHFSNGSIRQPNDGVNFVIVSASMVF